MIEQTHSKILVDVLLYGAAALTEHGVVVRFPDGTFVWPKGDKDGELHRWQLDDTSPVLSPGDEVEPLVFNLTEPECIVLARMEPHAALAWCRTKVKADKTHQSIDELLNSPALTLAVEVDGELHVASTEPGPIVFGHPSVSEVYAHDGDREVFRGTRDELVQALRRPRSPGADAWLGRQIKVFDHGYIELLDYMGNDAEVVRSARVTSDTKGRTPDDDRTLLRYMMRHRHTTPFEMCEARFEMQLPIFIARQFIRHRTANVNEYSMRYSPPIDAFYIPAPEAVCKQATSNRQGRGEQLTGEALQIALDIMQDGAHDSMTRYHRLADELGVARELARSVLPVSVFTRWVWKIDLHNLMHFLGLRLDPHAQLEARAYAEPIADIVRAWVPEAWAAFRDYRLEAVTFSRLELAALAALLPRWTRTAVEPVDELAREAGAEARLKGRELNEFVAKVEHVVGMPALDRVDLLHGEGARAP